MPYKRSEKSGRFMEWLEIYLKKNGSVNKPDLFRTARKEFDLSRRQVLNVLADLKAEVLIADEEPDKIVWLGGEK
jgi:hypothetical protein